MTGKNLRKHKQPQGVTDEGSQARIQITVVGSDIRFQNFSEDLCLLQTTVSKRKERKKDYVSAATAEKNHSPCSKGADRKTVSCS